LLNETVTRSGRGGNISSDVNFVGRKRDEKKINGLYTNRRLHQRYGKDREANLVFKEFHPKTGLKMVLGKCFSQLAACTSYNRQFLLTFFLQQKQERCCSRDPVFFFIEIMKCSESYSVCCRCQKILRLEA
jgi:hypothetical protein